MRYNLVDDEEEELSVTEIGEEHGLKHQGNRDQEMDRYEKT